jgi:hypothetical protein
LPIGRKHREDDMTEVKGRDASDELFGEAKKEAFHLKAEEGVTSFAFARPEVAIPHGKKLHVKLAGTDSCRASVLKGRVRFYGPGNKILGEYGVHEGLLLPENSRYWFESIGEEEAYLLQIAGYPKGAKMSKRVPVEPAKPDKGGMWMGLTEDEEVLRQKNNRL